MGDFGVGLLFLTDCKAISVMVFCRSRTYIPWTLPLITFIFMVISSLLASLSISQRPLRKLDIQTESHFSVRTELQGICTLLIYSNTHFGTNKPKSVLDCSTSPLDCSTSPPRLLNFSPSNTQLLPSPGPVFIDACFINDTSPSFKCGSRSSSLTPLLSTAYRLHAATLSFNASSL